MYVTWSAHIRSALSAAVACAALLLATAAPASAHVTGGGTYRAELEAVDPPTDVVTVAVVGEDQGLAITATDGSDVLVRDPSGRPFGRIDADGTWRRVWPDDPNRPVNWYRVDGSRTLELAVPWIDDVPATFDEGAADGTTSVGDWTVDIDVDGTRHVAAGELVFEPSGGLLGQGEYLLTGIGVLAMLVVFVRDGRRRRAAARAR